MKERPFQDQQNARKATLDGKNQQTEGSGSSIYGSSGGLLIICSSRVGANSGIYGSSSKIIMAPIEHGPKKCAPPKPSFKSQTVVLLLPSNKSNTVYFLFHLSKIPYKKPVQEFGLRVHQLETSRVELCVLFCLHW